MILIQSNSLRTEALLSISRNKILHSAVYHITWLHLYHIIALRNRRLVISRRFLLLGKEIMKKELLQYASLARFLKASLGERYSVALVDADNTDCEITVSEQGFSETGAGKLVKAGILSDILDSTELKKQDYFCCFSDSDKVEAGEKNSIFYIRNDKGEISGFLCIYEKREELYPIREVLDELLRSEEQTAYGSDHIKEQVNSLLRERIVEVWNRHNLSDKKMKKPEKTAFISELFEMGIFRMKNAAVQVSEVTGISLASIYRYLGEVLED